MFSIAIVKANCIIIIPAPMLCLHSPQILALLIVYSSYCNMRINVWRLHAAGKDENDATSWRWILSMGK